MSKVLVSNGNIGVPAAILLAQKGHQVSLLVRKPESKPELEKLGIGFTVGDAAKPETLTKVFDGVDAFFFISPFVENMETLASNLIQAAKKAGVKHIVRSSARGASVNAPIVMGQLHGRIEELIKQSGIPYTIVQPASFFQNLLGNAKSIQEEGVFYGSSGDGKNAWVDARDIAAVAATAIDEGSKHAGKTYVVTGSELLNNADLAKAIGAATGADVKYIDLSGADLQSAYVGAGLSSWTANAFMELDDITRKGYLAEATDDVKNVTGKEPRRFQDFAKENAGAFKRKTAVA